MRKTHLNKSFTSTGRCYVTAFVKGCAHHPYSKNPGSNLTRPESISVCIFSTNFTIIDTTAPDLSIPVNKIEKWKSANIIYTSLSILIKSSISKIHTSEHYFRLPVTTCFFFLQRRTTNDCSVVRSVRLTICNSYLKMPPCNRRRWCSR